MLVWVAAVAGCSSSSTNPETSSGGTGASGGMSGGAGSSATGGSSASGGAGAGGATGGASGTGANSGGGQSGSGATSGNGGTGGAAGCTAAGTGGTTDYCSGAAGGVGDPTPCNVDFNIVKFDGQCGDFIHPTSDVIQTGNFTAKLTGDSDIVLTIIPYDPKQGTDWELEFRSVQLGQPLGPGSYWCALRAGSETAGHAGFSVTGGGHGCNTSVGAFQIITLETTGTTLTSFTATFEQSCEQTEPPLRGCIHYKG